MKRGGERGGGVERGYEVRGVINRSKRVSHLQ